ncbi:MAG: hypothetical protein V1761_03305 [bacterium]
MVHVITGTIDACKTTKLVALYNERGEGDGYVMIKRMIGRLVRGYDAHRLSTGEEWPLVWRDGYEPENFVIACSIGPYLFSAPALAAVENGLRAMIAGHVAPLWLDEIGELELNGRGFDAVMKAMVASGAELYVVVRDDLVERVLARYGIDEYETIESI